MFNEVGTTLYGRRSDGAYITTSTDYHLQAVPLCWRQVLSCYLALLFMSLVLLYIFGGGLRRWAWHALH